MEPLVEDIAIRLKIDDKEWMNGLWTIGDSFEDYFTANRTTKSYVVIASTGDNGLGVYLSDKYLEPEYLLLNRQTFTSG